MSEPINKWSHLIRIPLETLYETEYLDRFPRKHSVIVHPVTPEQQAEYDAFAERFRKMQKEWQELTSEGERKHWCTTDRGYEYDPAELEALTERREYVYEETTSEHRARVQAILDHHAATGEWLEMPEPTFMDRVRDQMRATYNTAMNGATNV